MSGPVGHARYCRIRIRSRITGSWQYTATKYMQWLTSDSHVNSEKHGRKQSTLTWQSWLRLHGAILGKWYLNELRMNFALKWRQNSRSRKLSHPIGEWTYSCRIVSQRNSLTNWSHRGAWMCMTAKVDRAKWRTMSTPQSTHQVSRKVILLVLASRERLADSQSLKRTSTSYKTE